MSWFFACLILIVLAYSLLKIFEWKKLSGTINLKTKKPPRGRMMLDMLKLIFMKQKKSMKDTILDVWDKYVEEGEDKVMVDFFFTTYRVHIGCPKMAKEVFQKERTHFEKFMVPNYAGDFIGRKNVLSANGELWAKQTKVLHPAFYKIETFLDSFIKKSKKSIQFIETKKGKISNILDFTQHLTLDILGETVFGYEFNSIDVTDEKKPFVEAYERFWEELFNVKYIFFPWLKKLSFLEYNKKMTGYIRTMDDLAHDLIEKSRQKIKSNPNSANNLLDFMVSANMPDQEMRDNVLTFFVAGHDTTSTSLSFGIHRLAKHLRIQEKMRNEILEIFGKNGEILYEKIPSMKYTEAFIKEILRYHSPAANIPIKIVSKPFVKIGNYKFPKGTNIIISTFKIHFSKEIYGDPKVFRPERWLDTKRKIKSSSWIPFSSGPRGCLGKGFSMLEQKVFYALLVRDFQITLDDPKYEVKQQVKRNLVSKVILTDLTFTRIKK